MLRVVNGGDHRIPLLKYRSLLTIKLSEIAQQSHCSCKKMEMSGRPRTRLMAEAAAAAQDQFACKPRRHAGGCRSKCHSGKTGLSHSRPALLLAKLLLAAAGTAARQSSAKSKTGLEPRSSASCLKRGRTPMSGLHLPVSWGVRVSLGKRL